MFSFEGFYRCAASIGIASPGGGFLRQGSWVSSLELACPCLGYPAVTNRPQPGS